MQNPDLKTYMFPVKIEHEADGRWSASCPSLPGCATWGISQEDVLVHIREAVEVYVEDMTAAGEILPIELQITNAPAVSVTL